MEMVYLPPYLADFALPYKERKCLRSGGLGPGGSGVSAGVSGLQDVIIDGRADPRGILFLRPSFFLARASTCPRVTKSAPQILSTRSWCSSILVLPFRFYLWAWVAAAAWLFAPLFSHQLPPKINFHPLFQYLLHARPIPQCIPPPPRSPSAADIGPLPAFFFCLPPHV